MKNSVRFRSFVSGKRASVVLIFALSLFMVVLAVGISIDFSRMVAGRVDLQRAVDNAALAGASAVALDTSANRCAAVSLATASFLNATQSLPGGFSITPQSGNTVIITNSGFDQCTNAAGPAVAASDRYGYITGTEGPTANLCTPSTGSYVSGTTVNCAFIIKVSATATYSSAYPSLFSPLKTISVSGMAANPFVNLSRALSFPAGIQGSAKYANSIWVYPVLLTATGAVDYTTNSGALPNTAPCTNGSLANGLNGPDEAICGNYVMLANAQYVNSGTITVAGVNYINGVVQNPTLPNQITSTTPLGFAFKSIAGGNETVRPPPNAYGYLELLAGSGSYVRAPGSACIYPASVVYNTVTMPYHSTVSGGITTYAPLLAWPQATHWFYSSYLPNNLPPSEGEIVSQQNLQTSVYSALPFNQDTASVINDPSELGANISGQSTYVANPTPAVPTNCPATSAVGITTVSNDEYSTSTYPLTGSTNGSLYITKSPPGTPYSPPDPSYKGINKTYFLPTSTPGQAYAAQSCQQYGTSIFTFYWNDMGGATYDDTDYNNGSLQVNCNGPTHVLLIQ